jgi:hypothetical protein
MQMYTINKIKEARRPHMHFISFSRKSVWTVGERWVSLLNT